MAARDVYLPMGERWLSRCSDVGFHFEETQREEESDGRDIRSTDNENSNMSEAPKTVGAQILR